MSDDAQDVDKRLREILRLRREFAEAEAEYQQLLEAHARPPEDTDLVPPMSAPRDATIH